MNARIKTHVDSLFEGAPQTSKVLDLKEELLANLNSKYDDLITGGAAEDDAYHSVIAGIGDISELVRQIQNESAFNSHYSSNERKKSALFVAIAIGLYIISPMCVVAFKEKGVLVMFVLIAVATGILIYNGMTRPKYVKEDETIVEEFKQWKSENSETKRLRKSISSVLWPLIVVIFLAFSILTGAWGISWIIFIIGVFIEGVITLIFEIKGQ